MTSATPASNLLGMGVIARLKAVLIALSYRGTPYVWGGGHGPNPGETTVAGRTGFDCSGAARLIIFRTAGRDLLGPGTSESYWAVAFGGRVATPNIRPGMLVYFTGSDGNAKAPGHIGIVVDFDPATGTGHYLSAYDTADGTLVEPFTASPAQGFVGATDPLSTIPDPVPSAATLHAEKLVKMANVAQATVALRNGWPLLYWDGAEFIAQQQGRPTGVDLYASTSFSTHAGHVG